MSTQKLDLMTLSDEEFEKLSSVPEGAVLPMPPVEAAEVEEEPVVAEDPKDGEKPEVATEEDPAKPKEEPVVAAEGETKDKPVEEEKTEKLVDPEAKGPDVFAKDKDGKPKEGAAAEAKPDDKKEAKKPDEKPVEGKKDEKPTDPSTTTDKIDYKAFYDRVMAPFNANGKTIKLENADEVISLMQMGANYTKKMQAIQPHKKLIMMLENNNLLDENKLSFLIDLDKKNPEAIKKLLKDANIDPIEVDTSKVNYRSGSHAVSDQEAALQSAIEDLNARDGGKETLQSVHSWDQASKKVLWENPGLLEVFRQSRVNGVYDRITTEMERRRTLGQLPTETPFLQAYKIVGDELAARGAFQSLSPKPQDSGQKPVGTAPVAVRPAGKTPPTKADDNRVKAAASPRTTPRTAVQPVNYLAMSDEEFMKLPLNKI
jgi:hypothetical protein